MRKAKYDIGQVKLFKYKTESLLGTVQLVVDTGSEFLYEMCVVLDNSESVFTVKESDIVDIVYEKPKSQDDVWLEEHRTEINAAFGEDVSNHVFLLFDTQDEVCEVFEDCVNSKWCKFVADKWIVLLG